MKWPNLRVHSQFLGFKSLAFEFHKARFPRTWGSQSTPRPVNCKQAVCVRVPWGFRLSPGAMQGHGQHQANQFPISYVLFSQLDLSMDKPYTYDLWGFFLCSFHTCPFPISPPYSLLSLLWWINPECQPKGLCEIMILRKQTAWAGEHILLQFRCFFFKSLL